jgi:hypothetical protein
MNISKVTNEDGIALANLINFLKVGRWDLSSKDAQALMDTMKWVSQLASEVGRELQAAKKPAEKPTSPSSPAPQVIKPVSKKKKKVSR